MDIKVNDYVKWAISGGWAFGQITSINNDARTSKVTLASGQNGIEIKNEDVEVISASDYKNELINLGRTILTKAGVDPMTELEQVQNELKTVKESFEKAKSDLETKDAELNSAKSLFDEMKKTKEEKEKLLLESEKVVEEAKSELEKVRLASLAESRFNQLGKDAVFIAFKTESETDAKDKLAKLSEEAYSFIVNLSQSAVKSTDQTLTNVPKLTDQTLTSETKTTDAAEAVEKVETEVAKATLENDPIVPDNTGDTNADFSSAMNKFFANS